MVEIVDLSQEIYHKHPLHHLHPPTVMWTHHTYEEADHILSQTLGVEEAPFAFTSKVLQMNEHASTHVDSLAHLGPGGATIDEMDWKHFYGPGKAIEVSHLDPESDDVAGPEELEAACEAADVTVEAGDVLLIDTGHYERTHPGTDYVESYFGLSAAAVEWMLDRGVVNFGVDAPSPDNSSDATYPVHQVCRDEGLPHMENLRNIGAVVGREFTFSGLPLKIREGTGGPMRAVAILE